MRVTLGQLAVGVRHERNLRSVEAACEAARAAGSDLLVLPEYASGYTPSGVGAEHAERVDGPFVTMLQEQTAGSSLAVVAGMVLDETVPEPAASEPAASEHTAAKPAPSESTPSEPAASPGVSNAVLAVADGQLLGIYRKVHLYDAFGHRESDRLEAGDPAAEPLVVEVAGLRVGVMTCYDLRFPESARRLVDAGAQVLVVPAAWASGPGKVEQWRVLARARAIENVSVVVAVGQAGPGVVGHSLVVTPDGGVLTELGDLHEVRTAEVGATEVERARSTNPSLANRRFRVVPGRPADRR